uniref:Uncharacterized protein n=2 Tax=Ditylum brightwellii TaxID=49249 RepID=A0A7S4T7Y0_9STRA
MAQPPRTSSSPPPPHSLMATQSSLFSTHQHLYPSQHHYQPSSSPSLAAPSSSWILVTRLFQRKRDVSELDTNNAMKPFVPLFVDVKNKIRMLQQTKCNYINDAASSPKVTTATRIMNYSENDKNGGEMDKRRERDEKEEEQRSLLVTLEIKIALWDLLVNSLEDVLGDYAYNLDLATNITGLGKQ